jgi:hypothetical protein
MQEVLCHTDRLGQAVKVGDEVRIVQVDVGPDVADDEREMFEYMIGAISEIERFDAAGRAWVTMWWNTDEGTATTSVGLSSPQMEKVMQAASRS